MTNSLPRSSPPAPAGKFHPWLPRLLRGTISLLVIAAVLFAARGSLAAWQDQSDAQRITLADIRWGWLAIAALAYALSLLPSGIVLRLALTALHHPVSPRLVMAAQLVGHLGKYVPGKAMVIILRASILNRGAAKISVKLSAIAVIIETLHLIAVGATIGLLLVMILDAPAALRWTSGVMALGAVVATLPPVLRLVLARKLRSGSDDDAPRKRGGIASRLIQPVQLDWTLDQLIATWFWCAVSWLLTGLSMTAVVLAIIPDSVSLPTLSLVLICSAATMLAFVAGFASLLPGGAGVREMVLAALLDPTFGAGPALLAAIVSRLVQLAVEITLAAAIWTTLLRAAPVTQPAGDGEEGPAT